jgi:hypothetical protein
MLQKNKKNVKMIKNENSVKIYILPKKINKRIINKCKVYNKLIKKYIYNIY